MMMIFLFALIVKVLPTHSKKINKEKQYNWVKR